MISARAGGGRGPPNLRIHQAPEARRADGEAPKAFRLARRKRIQLFAAGCGDSSAGTSCVAACTASSCPTIFCRKEPSNCYDTMLRRPDSIAANMHPSERPPDNPTICESKCRRTTTLIQADAWPKHGDRPRAMCGKQTNCGAYSADDDRAAVGHVPTSAACPEPELCPRKSVRETAALDPEVKFRDQRRKPACFSNDFSVMV